MSDLDISPHTWHLNDDANLVHPQSKMTQNVSLGHTLVDEYYLMPTKKGYFMPKMHQPIKSKQTTEKIQTRINTTLQMQDVVGPYD